MTDSSSSATRAGAAGGRAIGQQARQPGAMLDLTRRYVLGDFTLDGVGLDVSLPEAVQSIAVNRSMTAAWTLTVNLLDEDHALLAADALLGAKRLTSRLLLEVDEQAFVLHELTKTRFGEQLVFWDAATSALCDQKKIVRYSRGQATRAQVIAALCQAAGVRLWSPELLTKQPIHDLDRDALKQLDDAKQSAAEQDVTRREQARGALRGKGITLRGSKPNSSQLRNMELVQAIADKLGAKPKARLALTEACLVEGPDFYNNPGGDATSRGVLQLLASTASGLGVDPMDVEAVARLFLTRGFYGKGGAMDIAKAHPEYTAGNVAQATQGSAYPDRYDKRRDDATAIIRAWDPGAVDDDETATGTPDRAYVEQYEFAVEAGEDYFETGVRLGDEVLWRFFPIRGGMAYASDLTLAEQPTALVLVRGQDGCEDISGTWTRKGRIDEATATVRATDRTAAPGHRIVVDDSEGALAGVWLLHETDRADLLAEDQAVTYTLHRPERPLPEPASTVATIAGTPATGGDETDDVAGGGKDGKWKLGPNANRPGVGLTKTLKSFVDLMATYYDGTLVLSTGTNHSQYSSSNLLSDHWTGNAGDFGMVLNGGSDDSPVGDRIATAALRAAGKSYADATRMARAGGLINVQKGSLRVQVIWKTNEGGNHHNHVHVGVKATG